MTVVVSPCATTQSGLNRVNSESSPVKQAAVSPANSVGRSMTDTARQPPATALASAAQLRLITIDELSTVRYLHDIAIRRLAASHLSEAELEAFCAYVNSIDYTNRLAEQVRAGRLIGATLMDDLVASAGWIPANDSGVTARMMAVFVSPLYALNGIGRLVVGAAEAEAQQAGFKILTIRAPIGSVGFFGRLDYEVASHGVWTLPGDQPMPVGFMRKAVAKA